MLNCIKELLKLRFLIFLTQKLILEYYLISISIFFRKQLSLNSQILNHDDINYICDLVKEAGNLACQMRANVKIYEKTGPFDCVTEADNAISKLIVDRLAKRFYNDKIISEEEANFTGNESSNRTWLVDPIDGTQNYIDNDGQYAVMIGLIQNLKPVFGFVHAPATGITYYGGPDFSLVCLNANQEIIKLEPVLSLSANKQIRVIMGYRDRKKYPWIKELPNVSLIKSGSIGIKIVKIIENDADLYVHFDAKLKTWDTAGPIAIALAAGLDVGSLDKQVIVFPQTGSIHKTTIVIGKPGALDWSSQFLVKS